jgi:hypothetical protein
MGTSKRIDAAHRARQKSQKSETGMARRVPHKIVTWPVGNQTGTETIGATPRHEGAILCVTNPAWKKQKFPGTSVSPPRGFAIAGFRLDQGAPTQAYCRYVKEVQA